MIIMTSEDAIKFIDSLLEQNPQKTEKGMKKSLNNTDKQVIRRTWNNDGYNTSSLRNAGSKLWKIVDNLIDANGEKVTKFSFATLIETAWSKHEVRSIPENDWQNIPPDWRKAKEVCPSWPAHGNGIGGITISPNQQIFASGSWDASICLWSLDTGKLLQTLAAPKKTSNNSKDDFKDVAALAFTPDGDRLISASYDCTIKIWELNTGKLLATLRKDTDHPHRSFNLGSKVEALALSNDGQVLASGDFDNRVYLWDLQNPQSIHKFQTSSEVLSLAFSPNSWKLCCGCLDGTVYVWDLQKSLELKFTASKGFISSIVTSPDSQKIYSGDEYGTITIWDINTGVKIGTWPGQHKSAILTLAFHPQSPNVLASSGYDKKIIFWNLNSGKPLHKLSTDQGAVTAIFFNKDGNILVAGDEFGNITLWQTTNQFSSSL
jgi:WD40 repeat protein